MYSKSFEIDIRVHGDSHPDVAATYQNVGNVHHFQENIAAATKMYTKAYYIRLKVLGPDHPHTVSKTIL
jgi:hypothetical protein